MAWGQQNHPQVKLACHQPMPMETSQWTLLPLRRQTQPFPPLPAPRPPPPLPKPPPASANIKKSPPPTGSGSTLRPIEGSTLISRIPGWCQDRIGSSTSLSDVRVVWRRPVSTNVLCTPSGFPALPAHHAGCRTSSAHWPNRLQQQKKAKEIKPRCRRESCMAPLWRS